MVKLRKSRGVSPVIAILLLIAITVSTGVVLYVFVSGLSARLAPVGGSQVGEKFALDAYNFPAPYENPLLIIRNLGSASATISVVYYDGSLCVKGGQTCSGVSISPRTMAVEGTSTITLTVMQALPGTTHTVKVVMQDGASITSTLVAGQSG